MSWNILTSDEGDLRIAFDLIEGEGFFDRSNNPTSERNLHLTIKGWHDYYKKIKDERVRALAEIERVEAGGQSDSPKFLEEKGKRRDEILAYLREDYDEFGTDSIPYTIYGRGGFNRYYVGYDGVIWFASSHASWFQTRDARDLGFAIQESGFNSAI